MMWTLIKKLTGKTHISYQNIALRTDSDLPLNIQDAKLALFVDYINILFIDKNIDAIQESLNRVMKQFETWFSNNSLIITTDKTQGDVISLQQNL